MRVLGDADGLRSGASVRVFRVVRHLSGGPVQSCLPPYMSDFNKPMGNAELRLTLQRVETMATEARDNTAYTNGTVRWQTKMVYLAMGAIPLLSVWAGWLTLEVLQTAQDVSSNTLAPQQIQAAVDQAFQSNLERTNQISK